MTNQEKFHLLVGETIMFCQCIEHDIKVLYAGMLKGEFTRNFASVNRKGLGTVVKLLSDLDNSDGNPYLGCADYKLLADIATIRNHWAHQGYVEYIYETDKADAAFTRQYNRLNNDHNRLQKLYRLVEQVRINFFRN